ncbi:GNAT family N-acetyltransferase [Utexia brackfieldae]|uniref:GNAT family N-acetyltransferase n=1 Tax=Utexia brackfieldae TaxID=3074108 RepID=UPI00370D990E
MKYLEGNNRFYVPGPDGKDDIAEITYQLQGDNIAIIDHTFVDVNYRGQGIADRLFELVVEKMRAEGRKIVPLCSFAVKQFERKSHYRDMLANTQ